MKNIHVLPTDKPSRLYLTTKEYVFEEVNLVSTDECQNKHIYITSDEEIKDGDWVITPNPQKPLEKVTKETYLPHYNKKKKIILTTDQDLIKDGVQAIDDEFLEWFVKNPSCERVEIVFNNRGITGAEKILKTFGDYKIIIPTEEPKQETLEEAIDRISKENGYDIEGGKVADFVDGMVKGAKWQQERMYSEEKINKVLQKLEEIKIMINVR